MKSTFLGIRYHGNLPVVIPQFEDDKVRVVTGKVVQKVRHEIRRFNFQVTSVVRRLPELSRQMAMVRDFWIGILELPPTQVAFRFCPVY